MKNDKRPKQNYPDGIWPPECEPESERWSPFADSVLVGCFAVFFSGMLGLLAWAIWSAVRAAWRAAQ